MNRKARINYIHALSSQVERKKMYKAKKQWVVAGISFLVATGMGAIGSHLTTHAASTTQAKAQTTLPINKGSQSKQIGSAANNLHKKLIGNAAPQINQKPQVSGSQVSSSNAKSSTTSNVVNSGNSMNTLKLGNSSEQNKGWNYVQSGIKPSTNNSKVSNTSQISSKKNKPMMLFSNVGDSTQTTVDGATVYPDGTVKGIWGTAPWTLSNTGALTVGTGKITNQYWDWYMQGHQNQYASNFKKEFNISNVGQVGGLTYNIPYFRDFNNVKKLQSISFYNTQVSDIPGLFMYLPNVKNIDLTGLTITDNIRNSLSNVFMDDSSLQSILGMQSLGDISKNINNFSGFLAGLSSIKSIDLSSFDLSKASTVNGMLGGDKNLTTINMGNNFKIGNVSDITTMWNSYINKKAINEDKKISHLILNGREKFPNNSGIQYRWGYDSNTGNISDLFNGQPHSGNFTLMDTNNPNKWGTADLIVDNQGNIHVSKGTITHDLHDAKGIDWSKVNRVYFINDGLSVSDNSNPQEFNDEINELLADKKNDTNSVNKISGINPSDKWSDVNTVNNDKNTVNNAANTINDYYANLNDSDIDEANNDASAASSAAEDADVENLVASVDAKNSASASNAVVLASTSAQNKLNAYSTSNQLLISELADALNSASYAGGTFTKSDNSLLASAKALRSTLNQASQLAINDSNNADLFAANLNSALSGAYGSSSYNSSGNSLTASENSLIATASTDYKNWSNAANWVSTNGTNASNAGSWYSAHSASIDTIINSMNSADSAYTDATNAITSLNTINSQLNSSSTGIVSEISNLSSAIGSSNKASGLSALASDYTKLSSVDGKISDNSGEINKLKANTAITFTFNKPNQNNVHIPVTLTRAFITDSNNSAVSKNTDGTYNINTLLNDALSSESLHVVGNYNVSISSDGTMSLSHSMPQAIRKFGVSLTKAPNPDKNNKEYNPVEVADNVADYTGKITVNFGTDGKHSKQFNFNTTKDVNNKINLLNQVSGANDPSSLENDNLISGFDTSGFSLANVSASDTNTFDNQTTSNITDSNAYNFEVSPLDADNPNGNDVHNYNIVLNYTAQSVKEKINYEYNNGTSLVNEGSATTSSADDASGNWTTSSGLNSGWTLSNASSNPFTYTSNGSSNVMVVPQQASAYIEYVNSDTRAQIGSTSSFGGNSYAATQNQPQGASLSGSNSFVINSSNASNYGLPAGYTYNSSTSTIYYNNNSNTPTEIYVTGESRSAAEPIKPSDNNKPSDPNDARSPKSMTKPTSDSNVLFTIHVIDYDAQGKNKVGSDYKYITESDKVGKKFTIDPATYQTYGFNIRGLNGHSDKVVSGQIGNQQLEPNSVTFTYVAIPYNPADAAKNQHNPAYPKPITVKYLVTVDGKTNQPVGKSFNISDDAGTTVSSKTAQVQNNVPKGYIIDTSNTNNNDIYKITTEHQILNVYLKSLTASEIAKANAEKNGKKYVPYKPTVPSDSSTTTKPSNSDVSNNTKNGYATITIVEKDPHGYNHSYETVNETGLGTGNTAYINATSFTPSDYQINTSDNDKALEVKANSDGSLSAYDSNTKTWTKPAETTFYYDVNASDIAPIQITYVDPTGKQYIDKNNGTITNNESDATVTISSSELAKLGNVGDTVSIASDVNKTVPKGHHLSDLSNLETTNGHNLNQITLQQATKDKDGISKAINLSLMMPTAPKPNSNSTKPSSSAAQVSMSSDQLASLAKDIGSNITIKPNVSETDEVVDNSALTSLASEVATNNQEISNLANKPTSAESINYDYFNNLVNNGVSKLTNAINKDFKSNIRHVHAKTLKPRITVGKRTYSYLKWLRVVKPLKLYTKNGVAKVIKPKHRITLNVKAAYKVHNHIVFKVSYRSHNYFIKANNKAIKNAYLPATKRLVGRRVRVLYNVYANRRKASGRVKTLHKGYKSTIKHIVRIGNHNVTRIQLTDGLWISANMNYVEVL